MSNENNIRNTGEAI